ncbi:MAG: hypothetical protein JWO94_3795 [Verrucomicrobiaceae bacterium]|nr:hypothetical protein [Verrucomicrobiaceae bacterium]
MKHHPLILIPLLAVGCASPHSTHPIAREMRRVGVEPESFTIKDEDAQMGNAVTRARRTVGTFIAAVRNPTSGQRDFEVKKPFKQGEVTEHIWLSDVTYSGGRFHGKVDNKPRDIDGLKYGTRVSVNPNEITDWAFVNNGELVGGYTIRLLHNELSPERRVELEKQLNCHIAQR